ncbi:MAG: FAD-binding oxidoreductase [Bernardetiaceae bacterium]|nr:FAD-binding oxidoreductase [Bernardetiaceae bacterium]
MIQKIDYLIIGQGIAGSCMAWQLEQKQQSFVILDAPQPAAASRVAAGLFNPITGRNFVLTWLAEKIFPYAENFYPKIENQSRAKFFYPTPMFRPFVSVKNQNDWELRAEVLDQFAKKEIQNPYPQLIDAPLGGLHIQHCGYLDTLAFLEATRRFFQDKGQYQEILFDEQALQIQDECIIYKSWKAKRIIFCRGVEDATSKYWNFLPFHPAKGELLSIVPNQAFEPILNRSCWIFPHADNTYKVGATYDHQNLNTIPTVAARANIERRLQDFFKPSYQVVAQQAGIRPATKDRRPFIGQHHIHKPLFICNGFGAKAVSLAPYLTDCLLTYCQNQKSIPEEVDVKRFQ